MGLGYLIGKPAVQEPVPSVSAGFFLKGLIMEPIIHFSDGEKAVCGVKSKDAQAVTDAQKVTCKKCIAVMAQKAKKEEDPLVKVRVKNNDIPDGADFAFNFEGKGYHLISNAGEGTLLPKSVVEHLRGLAYPFKRYVAGQAEGQSMVAAGKRYRFTIQEL